MGSWWTRLAVGMSDRVFCTSAFSYTAGFKKTKIMPVGIDTEIFKEDSSAKRIERSILFMARMSPVKKLDVFLSALKTVKESGQSFYVELYGNADAKDAKYLESQKEYVRRNGLDGFVYFHDAIPNIKTPKIYSRHSVFVNLTGNGSYDKTIFEAMACGCMPLVSNDDLSKKLPPEYITNGSSDDLARKLIVLLQRNINPDIQKMKNMVENDHSLKKLAAAIAEECK